MLGFIFTLKLSVVPFTRTMLLLTQVSDDKEKEKAERKRLQIVHAPKASNRAKLVAIIIIITIIIVTIKSDVGAATDNAW